jgi:AraC family transcriptional regulator
MPQNDIRNDYRERINRVLHYIDEHLDEKLDLGTLASVSCFSPYHFHRIMRAHLDESLGSYIIRQRLQAAAMLLAYSDKPVAAIAYEVGYETPSSLTKAFRGRFGVSPSAFRDNNTMLRRDHVTLLFNLKETDMELKPEIRQMEDIKVIYIRSTGDYNNVGPVWERLCSFAAKKNLFGPGTMMFGLSHDDPEITETARLRYDACLSVESEVKGEGEVGMKMVEGGRFAVFVHKGPYRNLQSSYNDIYRNWYPQSGHELRDAPPLEIYLNDPGKTRAEDLRTEIWIPVG